MKHRAMLFAALIVMPPAWSATTAAPAPTTAAAPAAPAAVTPAALTPAHQQAARDLLQQIDVERSMGIGAETMADTMIRQNGSLAPYRDVLLKWSSQFMTWEVFGPKLTQIYAAAFTEKELRELAAFYKTPVGRKSLAVMPELSRSGAQIGASIAQAHLEDLQQMMQAREQELARARSSNAPAPAAHLTLPAPPLDK